MFWRTKVALGPFDVIDEYNTEALHIEIDFSVVTHRVIWRLKHPINKKGKAKIIRMDNDPEFIA